MRKAAKRSSLAKIVLVVGLVLLLMLGLQIAMGAGVAHLMKSNWPTMTPLEARFASMRIRAEDLPFGWRAGGIQTEEVPGAEGRFYWYYGTSDPKKTWVNVSQKLIIYTDSQAAADAYDGWVAKYIPPAHQDDWIQPPGLEFDSQADQMVVACLSGYINGMHHYACRSIGRYKDTIVILLGNVFDDQWLKMEDFQAVLEAIDQRMVAATDTEQ